MCCRGVVVATPVGWYPTPVPVACACRAHPHARAVFSGLHRRRSVDHSSAASIRTAPTSRCSASVDGNTPTDEVRRLISRFSRSCTLFVRILSQWSLGNAMYARHSSRAAVNVRAAVDASSSAASVHAASAAAREPIACVCSIGSGPVEHLELVHVSGWF